MMNKSRKQSTKEKSGRVKVGKLKVIKETVKDLSQGQVKNIKGGVIRVPTGVQQKPDGGSCPASH